MNTFSVFRNVVNHGLKIIHKIHRHQNLFVRYCTIRRALLYVPGSDFKKLEKAFQLKVDCIIMDCEDGVAANEKDNARQNIKKFLDKGHVTESDPEWCVRINAVQTQEIFEEDICTILSAKSLPFCICLPKVNNIGQLQYFAEKVWQNLIKRPENDRGPIKLLLLIESAKAMMTLPDLCKKAEDLATVAPIVPVGLILGSDDLSADLGVTRTQSAIEILYARQKLVLVGKAFGLQVVDMVYTNYKDQKGFTESCIDGQLLGFTGKQVIHPQQVLIAQENFVPSRAKIQWAKNIIKFFNENQQKGKGAFTFENNMIDMPTVKQAENIIKIAKAVGKLD